MNNKEYDKLLELNNLCGINSDHMMISVMYEQVLSLKHTALYALFLNTGCHWIIHFLPHCRLLTSPYDNGFREAVNCH